MPRLSGRPKGAANKGYKIRPHKITFRCSDGYKWALEGLADQLKRSSGDIQHQAL